MIIRSKKNLGKKEIINTIKKSIGFSTKNISNITDDIIEAIIEILIDDKKINIKNFGTFSIIYKKKREGRNPKTKEKFNISPRNVVKFKISNSLKKEVNQI